MNAADLIGLIQTLLYSQPSAMLLAGAGCVFMGLILYISGMFDLYSSYQEIIIFLNIVCINEASYIENVKC